MNPYTSTYQMLRRVGTKGIRVRQRCTFDLNITSSRYRYFHAASTSASAGSSGIRANASVPLPESRRVLPLRIGSVFLYGGVNAQYKCNFGTHTLSKIYNKRTRCFASKAANELHKEDVSTSTSMQMQMQPATVCKPDIEAMDKRLLFQYMELKYFTSDEISIAVDRILMHKSQSQSESESESSKGATIPMQSQSLPQDNIVSDAHMEAFFLDRIKDIDTRQERGGEVSNVGIMNGDTSYRNVNKDLLSEDEDESESECEIIKKQEEMKSFAALESQRAIKLILNDDIAISNNTAGIQRADLQRRISELATKIDTNRTIPISASMVLVGSSVGIIIPIMPYVVSNLGLTAGQFGIVVSSFALAKLFANVPAAVLVERHGRKPYLVHSLVIISMGVGGIGLATQLEHLILCRTLTGLGVSLLSTAATLAIADCSTPLNRARTMAPMMSGFAAGTALGPAVGGLLADRIGIQSTFYLVGGMYLAVASINQMILSETKMVPEKERIFPWQQSAAGRKRRQRRLKKEKQSMSSSIQGAVSQWRPLMADNKVRNVALMNGFYWVALSGSQMTLLPLILTDAAGLAMSPTNVGEIYMGMSLVQVVCNPVMASFVDKMGKVPGIVAGCGLLSASMFTLPYCTEMTEVAGCLGFWSLGSTMLSTAPTAYISDLVREDQRAQAIALLRTAGDVGFLAGASCTGIVADIFNYEVAVHSSASLLLAATAWFGARRYMDVQTTIGTKRIK